MPEADGEVTEPSLIYAGRSDVGRRRSVNQDRFLAVTVDTGEGEATLLAVADGMGGAAGGEVASAHAVEELIEALTHPEASHSDGELLRAGILAANRAIFGHAQADPDLYGMGTTMVALLVRHDRAVVAHVGDSRAYLVRDGAIHRLTADHNWVAEQVRRGEISEEEAERSNFRNVLTRSVGVGANLQADVSELSPLQPGDVFLLCSDGLHGVVDDATIAAMAVAGDPDDAAAQLVDLANSRGGPDNITVVIGRVPGVLTGGALPPPPVSVAAQTVPVTPLTAAAVAEMDSPEPPSAPIAPSPVAVPAVRTASTGSRNRMFMGGIAAAVAVAAIGLFLATNSSGSSSSPATGTQPGTVIGTGTPAATSTAALTEPVATPSRTPVADGSAGGRLLPTIDNPGGVPAASRLRQCTPLVEVTRADGPCGLRISPGLSGADHLRQIQNDYRVSVACLYSANQFGDPDQPGVFPLAKGSPEPEDLILRSGATYRLLPPDLCLVYEQALPLRGPRPPTLPPLPPLPGQGQPRDTGAGTTITASPTPLR